MVLCEATMCQSLCHAHRESWTVTMVISMKLSSCDLPEATADMFNNSNYDNAHSEP